LVPSIQNKRQNYNDDEKEKETMRLHIKKVPSKSHFRTFDYEFYRGDELIAVCTNLHTANKLMGLELKKVKR
jgi:hypothetical protein